jgi:hypothetical protein
LLRSPAVRIAIAKAREIGADKELSESDELLRQLAKMKPKPRQKQHK